MSSIGDDKSSQDASDAESLVVLAFRTMQILKHNFKTMQILRRNLISGFAGRRRKLNYLVLPLPGKKCIDFKSADFECIDLKSLLFYVVEPAAAGIIFH